MFILSSNLESYSWVILIHHDVLHICHCVFITYWSVLHLREYYSVQNNSISLKFQALDKLLFKLEESDLMIHQFRKVTAEIQLLTTNIYSSLT